MPGHGRARIKSRATAGAEPRQGNSRAYCEADRKIDARSKTGTAPDEQTDMREPANKSLLTDVSRLCSYRCTIIASTTSDGIRGEAGLWRLQGLTWDIRACGSCVLRDARFARSSGRGTGPFHLGKHPPSGKTPASIPARHRK